MKTYYWTYLLVIHYHSYQFDTYSTFTWGDLPINYNWDGII